MKKWQRRMAIVLAGTAILVTGGQMTETEAVEAPASRSVEAPAVQGLQQVTAVTYVYGDGEQVAAAILAYPQALKPEGVEAGAFEAEGKIISRAYVAERPEIGGEEKQGPYVILEFAHQNSAYDGDLGQKPGRMEKQQGGSGDAPRRSNRKLPDLSLRVRQVQPVTALDGTEYGATEFMASTAVQEPEIALFQQHEYVDAKVGASIPYNLYLPTDYDPGRKYPLLFFVPDASANINAVTTPLFQGNGASVWTEPAEQAKHQCIVLAPQYTADLVEQLGMLTSDENVWTDGLTLVSDLLFDVIDRYSVDENRIYGTGQSQGGMTNIAISDKYPNLFAAQWLVACQWNVEEMSALKDKNLWITVCEGDTKAFPGMNEAVARWESLGSKVERNEEFWDSHISLAEINAKAQKMAEAEAPIKYSVFAGGNHMYTWSFAYDIEAVRDWLFAQRLDSQQERGKGHSKIAMVLQDAGVKEYKAGNYEKALSYFRSADAKENMKSPRYIGLCYERGYGVKQSYSMVAEWYSKAAERGDITGTYMLGRLYELGKGVPQNYRKAMELYLKSSQRGDIIAAPGMVAIAHMYEEGLGVEKNTELAQQWRDKARVAGYNE